MKRQYSSTEIIQAMITMTVVGSGDAYWRANDVLVWAEESIPRNELHKLNLQAIEVGRAA